ncbi:UAA transporter [Dichomitus squalens LYAD-421 SS1]|uniref:UDP-galactose transporter homolog 1 n=1 Tax=Dichomitus squalens TaxID=114155 RepID=A0A4Q9Q5K5_9APHY|nr:UAA transporter [Dichomitus squalens LYAD-421 SS1]EJF63362.1 UAA transporter [Dichomitus squalens LYAD-421 SS1]TBU62380.1 UAA transporter [Dichomitus squalens]
MSYLRLGLCVGGVYSMFLLWAIAQERLSVPFQHIDGTSSEKFNSPLFMGTCQSFLSALAALLYIYLRRKPGQTLHQILGLFDAPKTTTPNGAANGNASINGSANGHAKANGHTHTPHENKRDTRFDTRSLLLRYLQCAVLITSAAPFGFAALSYITYPAMVLGKSCKLVPVMIMNVLLYHRKFARHKYLVVAMVTLGITLFMGFGKEKPGKAKPGRGSAGAGQEGPSAYAQLIGITYLLINLLIDGATNSTQDEIFARYKVTGQQMMFWINVFCTALSAAISVLPLPYVPVLHPAASGTELGAALAFVRTHPSVVGPLAQFALTGALGQLFIFETLQHFGSLTLVTITLTRKLFTMLLSVVVYNHKLTPGQWLGAAVVFAGISVEAWVKRRDVHAKRVIQEKEKARIKAL